MNEALRGQLGKALQEKAGEQMLRDHPFLKDKIVPWEKAPEVVRVQFEEQAEAVMQKFLAVFFPPVQQFIVQILFIPGVAEHVQSLADSLKQAIGPEMFEHDHTPGMD